LSCAPTLTAKGSLVCALLLAWSSFGTGCTGTETGNPSFEGELSYDAYSSEPAVAALRQGERGAVVTEAWLVLGDVTFIDNNHCAEPEAAEGHAEGLGPGDHAPDGGARTRFWLPIGQYCGLRVPLERAGKGELPEGAPAELRDHSIVLSGELPERDGTPFLIASAQRGTLELEADDGSFELGPDSARVLLAFDLALWLDGIDLASAEPDADGRVTISDSSHPELLARFDENVRAGIDVFLDPEGEGKFENAGERIAVSR
jgi:hypothetical protein